jgi:hypothetical protein
MRFACAVLTVVDLGRVIPPLQEIVAGAIVKCKDWKVPCMRNHRHQDRAKKSPFAHQAISSVAMAERNSEHDS